MRAWPHPTDPNWCWWAQFAFIRDVQAGMHSRGFDTAVLNSDEARIRHCRSWLDHWMADG